MKTTTAAKVILFLILSIKIYSQCSDAGACSISGHTTNADDSKYALVSLDYSYGHSGKDADVKGIQNDLKYQSVSLSFGLALPDYQFMVNLPYNFTKGPLGSAKGIGDLLISGSRHFEISDNKNLSFSLGAKVKTGSVNSEPRLPQRYQPGLGTNDLLAGINYSYDNFYAGLVYQKTFGRSDNIFERLDRGDDFLFRIGYRYLFNDVGLKAELLTIKKLQEVSIIDFTNPGVNGYTEIPGTDETQINLLVGISFTVNKIFFIIIDSAVPFLKREYNYDGLKRAFTISGGISYKIIF